MSMVRYEFSELLNVCLLSIYRYFDAGNFKKIKIIEDKTPKRALKNNVQYSINNKLIQQIIMYF